MIALFVVLFSVGEAFYSPRVYEYAAAIAPKGLEASYSALSYVPFLLAKLLVGTFAGPLLATYCPEHGVRHSGDDVADCGPHGDGRAGGTAGAARLYPRARGGGGVILTESER